MTKTNFSTAPTTTMELLSKERNSSPIPYYLLDNYGSDVTAEEYRERI